MKKLCLLGLLVTVSGCVAAVPVDNNYPYNGYTYQGYYFYNDNREYNRRHFHDRYDYSHDYNQRNGEHWRNHGDWHR